MNHQILAEIEVYRKKFLLQLAIYRYHRCPTIETAYLVALAKHELVKTEREVAV